MTIIVRSNSLRAGFVSLLGESIFSSILFSSQSKINEAYDNHRQAEQPESGFCFFTWLEHFSSILFSSQSKSDKAYDNHREVEKPEGGFCVFTW